MLEGPLREAEWEGGGDLRLQEHLCVLDTKSPGSWSENEKCRSLCEVKITASSSEGSLSG